MYDKEYKKSYYEKNKERIKEYSRNHYKKNKERKKEYSKIYSKEYNLRKYTLSQVEYDNLLSKQDNKCAICNASKCASGRHFAVDHDHVTGRVRGLLCVNCNILLGYAKDNIDILEKAIEYLKERHNV